MINTVYEGVVLKPTDTEAQRLLAEVRELRGRLARVESVTLMPSPNEQLIARLMGHVVAGIKKK